MTEFAKAYGGALYALAQEENLEDVMRAQLTQVCAIMRDNPDYVRLLDTRSVPKAERVALIQEAFGDTIENDLLSFMKILCEQGAFSQLCACAEAFYLQYDEAHGIERVTAVSATPLSEEQVKRLSQALEQRTGKKIRLTVKVDASLRCGMRVEVNGKRLDNTIAGRMERLRRAMLAQT